MRPFARLYKISFICINLQLTNQRTNEVEIEAIITQIIVNEYNLSKKLNLKLYQWKQYIIFFMQYGLHI